MRLAPEVSGKSFSTNLSSLAAIINWLRLPIRSAISLFSGISRIVMATPARQDRPTCLYRSTRVTANWNGKLQSACKLGKKLTIL